MYQKRATQKQQSPLKEDAVRESGEEVKKADIEKLVEKPKSIGHPCEFLEQPSPSVPKLKRALTVFLEGKEPVMDLKNHLIN